MEYPYVIKLAVHHDCWSNPTEKVPDLSLRVFGISCEEQTAYGITKMTGTNEEKKRFYDAVRNHPYTLETKKKTNDCFFIRIKRDTAFYTKLIENNYIPENIVNIQDGIETEKLFGFSKKALMNSLNKIKEEREIKIVSVQPFAGYELTSKEQELLNLAIKRGYYELPRKTYIIDLANELDLKKSTIADRLRRIEKKIIQEYYSKN